MGCCNLSSYHYILLCNAIGGESMEIAKVLFHVLVFPGGLFAIAIALLMSGIDRKLVAKMQLRKGPPLLQPCYDFFKLLGKDTIIPKNAYAKMFLLAPIISLAAILVIPIFIPMYQNIFIKNSADIIVIIYLLTIPAVMLVIGGSSSSSTLAGIGSSREVVTMLAYELPMVLAILSVCRKAGEGIGGVTTFSMEAIQVFQGMNGISILQLSLIPAALAFLMVIPAEVGVVPFDMAEAETEICEGPLVEYSGLYLGLYKLVGNIKAFIISALFVALFLGGFGFNFSSNGVINSVLSILLFIILTIIVMFISITFLRSIVGRFKINQGLKFFWTVPTALAVISFILVSIGI